MGYFPTELNINSKFEINKYLNFQNRYYYLKPISHN
jgi:hypothetical protein